ncbi:MAG: hypothetical protein H0X62_14715 [Bacteroidetes bacterium]|nr:hypothetical protein [Bacteroidota bacterium]
MKATTKEAIQIDFEQEGEYVNLGQNTELCLYRIVQELLNNQIKHGTANKIIISLKFSPSSIELLIQDNGKKFNINEMMKKNPAYSTGMGLKNIESRLGMINAHLKYKSSVINTTTIILKMQAQ